MFNNKNILSWFVIFLLFFSYLTTAGFIFQKFILEFFANFNSHLLLSPESVIANEIAISLSEKLKINFWTNFTLIPQEGYSINISILAWFYYILGVNPYTNIIINSFFYSLSALFLLMSLLKISNISVWTRRSAYICSIIFLVWPSSLFLLSQITKDFISTFSFLLLILSFIFLYRANNSKSVFLYFLLSFLALTIMYGIRDHYLQIQFIIFLIMLVILLNRFLFIKFSLKSNHFYLIVLIISTLIFLTFNVFEKSKNYNEINNYSSFKHLKTYQLKDISDNYFPGKEIIWTKSNKIPDFIDDRLQAIASINIINNVKSIKYSAATPIKYEVELNSSYDFIKSFPQILYQGLFEPHPLRFDIKELKYLVVSLEMLFIYFCFALIFYIKNKSFDLLNIFIIASCFLFIIPISFTVATYGSLFRLRDPFLLIIALTILRIFITEYFNRQTNK